MHLCEKRSGWAADVADPETVSLPNYMLLAESAISPSSSQLLKKSASRNFEIYAYLIG